MFPKEKWIPHYSKSRGGLEKSEVLYIALEVGLEIPNTIITNNKNELENFTSKFNKIITKSIRNVEVITYKNYSLDVYTKILTLKEVQNLPEIFNYAKFQEYVEKDFEIRVFFIDDYIYSMAIFSQNDTMTKVDFRNYNISKPNRFVPFKLPKIIEEKLLVLTRKLGLRTGSFDLIYNSHKDKYYFLEVNPVGQFGMVSYNCNEPIEEKIADILTEINNKYISGKRYQENC